MRTPLRFHQLAEKVWDSPETCYAERLSVQAHLEELEYQKFKITEECFKHTDSNNWRSWFWRACNSDFGRV